MARLKAEQILDMRYHGKRNMMTPEICSIYLPRPNVAVELSKGKGVFDPSQDLYGVTVVAYDPNTQTVETIDSLSTVFYSHMDAMLYIHGIGEKLDAICEWDD
jgi:hypothetical protein